VRSLVLDGLVPPDWALGEATAPDARRALDLIFARCAADAGCSARFPDLPAEFDQLMARLAEEPVEVTIPDPVTAAPVRVLVSPQTAGLAVRMMSYSDLSAALIPLAVETAGQGDYSMLASQYLLTSNALEESLGLGMYFSVLCAEDAPYLPEALPEDRQGYFDPQFDVLRQGCAAWLDGAAPPPPPDWSTLQADTPALLISGEADPVTPPENAERVAALLPNSLHIVAPGLGHSNFYAGCIPNLLLDFLEAASPAGLDAACVQNVGPMPFFLSPTGPNP
jgi:pimeloyl-ACP methyl ester carboxylesterase